MYTMLLLPDGRHSSSVPFWLIVRQSPFRWSSSTFHSAASPA